MLNRVNMGYLEEQVRVTGIAIWTKSVLMLIAKAAYSIIACIIAFKLNILLGWGVFAYFTHSWLKMINIKLPDNTIKLLKEQDKNIKSIPV